VAPDEPDEAMDTAEAPRDIAVSTAQPDQRYELVVDPARDADADPRYRRVPGGEVVVPTGRLLVRFEDAERAADHAVDLADVGFEVDEVLSYAPQAAWVRPASGSVVDALRGVERLSELPGVVAVEPQMIGKRAQRD
jgi:hypothetical protein